jgi:hypothetical protein
MKLQVEGQPALVRDAKSKAIIMQDTNSFEVYRAEKAFRENHARSSMSTQEDINNIKDELKDIKELMFTLIQKLEHNKAN